MLSVPERASGRLLTPGLTAHEVPWDPCKTVRIKLSNSASQTARGTYRQANTSPACIPVPSIVLKVDVQYHSSLDVCM